MLRDLSCEIGRIAGVGVVDLDGGVVGQIMVIAAPGGTLSQNELGTGRDHQVLLVHPQAAACR